MSDHLSRVRARRAQLAAAVADEVPQPRVGYTANDDPDDDDLLDDAPAPVLSRPLPEARLPEPKDHHDDLDDEDDDDDGEDEAIAVAQSQSDDVTVLDDVEIHSVNLLAEEPNPAHGTFPIGDVYEVAPEQVESILATAGKALREGSIVIPRDPLPEPDEAQMSDHELAMKMAVDATFPTPEQVMQTGSALPDQEQLVNVRCSFCRRGATCGASFIDTPCRLLKGCPGELRLVEDRPMCACGAGCAPGQCSWDYTRAEHELPEWDPNDPDRYTHEAPGDIAVFDFSHDMLTEQEVRDDFDREVAVEARQEMAKMAVEPRLDLVDLTLWVVAAVVMPVWSGVAMTTAHWYEQPLIALVAVLSSMQGAAWYRDARMGSQLREAWRTFRWNYRGRQAEKRAQARAEDRWMR